MQVSFYSILMSVAWSGLFIIILSILRKFKIGLLCYNVTSLTVILIGCIIRCVLPLDFPGFTKPISSTGVFAAIDIAMETPVPLFGKEEFKLTPTTIFCIVWALGSLILGVFFFIREYCGARKQNRFTMVDEGLAYEIADSLCEEYGISCFRVCKDKSVTSPHVYGFKYPKIVLPTIPFTNAQLEIVIPHEFMHFLNGDMQIRVVALFILCLLWWNPFIYLLLRDVAHMLELKCDLALVTKMNFDAKRRSDYIDTLGVVTELCKERKREKKKRRRRFLSWLHLSSEFVDPFALQEIRERLLVIDNYVPDKRKERRTAIFTAVIMSIVMVFSYRYIVQPYFYVPQSEYTRAGGIKASPENTYLVKEADGYYSLFVNNKFYRKVTPKSAQFILDAGLFEVKNIDE